MKTLKNPPKLPGFVGKYTSHVILLFKPTKEVWFYPGLDLFDFLVLLPDTKKTHQKRQAKPYVKPTQKRGGCFQMCFQVRPRKFGGFMIHFDFPIFFYRSFSGTWDSSGDLELSKLTAGGLDVYFGRAS